MPRVPKGKKMMGVYISEDILEIFKQIVKQKHPDMYGLSAEVEDAMRLWIKQHTHEHTLPLQIEKVNPAPRIYQRWLLVRKRLDYEYGGEIPHQITRSDFEDAIVKEIGSDKRTIIKYLQIFQRLGLIKIISTGIVEVVG